jgi:5-methylcytosine-specific restriction endonuclease McrA
VNDALRLSRLVLANDPAARAMAERIDAQARARSRRVAVKRAPRRKAERAESLDKVAARVACRREVAARAAGKCEACGAVAGESLHWDHFHGRAREESVESTWMLCPRCDRQKTENSPSRIHWLNRFKVHCLVLGYREQVAKCDRLLALERVQHPERTTP